MNTVMQPENSETPSDADASSSQALDDGPVQPAPSDQEIAIVVARVVEAEIEKRTKAQASVSEPCSRSRRSQIHRSKAMDDAHRTNIMFMATSLVCGTNVLKTEFQRLLSA